VKYFAVSDNRQQKAEKIDAVLRDYLQEEVIKGKKILDLGCGSGHVAEYFSRANTVVAADVVEQMTTAKTDSLQFIKIDSSSLPFEENSFDIVIFNHVIYCSTDQLGQLKEIYRILKKDGICYLASANRYFPVEGFTKLPLIHYLPNRLFRSLYKTIRNTDVDLFPVGYHKLIGLIKDVGFTYREYTSEILKNPAKYHSEYAAPFSIPVPNCISPTSIFILRKLKHRT